MVPKAEDHQAEHNNDFWDCENLYLGGKKSYNFDLL